MNIDMTMFHDAFFEEAGDLLADFEGHLLRLEETPDDFELLNAIFRCAHSLKGGSATFGFDDIAHFTHGLETLLDRLRNGQMHVDSPLVGLLLESLDHLKDLVAAARGLAATPADLDRMPAKIEAALAASENVPEAPQPKADAPSEMGSASSRWRLRFVPGPDVLRRGVDPALYIAQLAESAEGIDVHCDTSLLPALSEMDPETCYLGWTIDLRSDLDRDALLEIFEFVADESEVVLDPLVEGTGDIASSAEPPILEPVDEPTEPPKTAAPAPSAPRTEMQSLRVSTEKVDRLVDLVGEMLINQSMLHEVVQDFSMAKVPSLLDAIAELDRSSRDLQESVMAIRMLPIRHAFGRFVRLVRDLASNSGKRVELKTVGEDTELDKTVIEAIGDPLTHLVRNAVDHGLEDPEQRRAAGKPETGSLVLNAFHEGGGIVVEVRDDGRGLDRDVILRKALERGLLAESDPTPSDDVIFGFIFQPGFSTAAKVTDVSGRGVGMDIVRQAVQGLGGSITLHSEPGKGTCFRIRLPLTLAILEGQSLAVGDEVYVLPLTCIVETIQPKRGDVRVIAGVDEVVVVRGTALPVIRLYEAFGSVPRFLDPLDALMVIVDADGHRVALMVDDLIGQNQAVIKSLESNYRKVQGIAGATILGDGRVALIVDAPELVRAVCAERAASAAA